MKVFIRAGPENGMVPRKPSPGGGVVSREIRQLSDIIQTSLT